MALTERQRRFVEAYLADPDLNATRAYIRSGYKARGHAAESSAWKLLRSAEVKAAIDAANEARRERAKLSADEVLQGIRRLANGDVRKLYHPDGRLKLPHEWDDDTADAVVQVQAEDETPLEKRGRVLARTTKVKLCDKLRARELLGRVVGLFKDDPPPPPAINVNVGVPFDPSKLTDDELRQLQALLGRAGGLGPGGGPAGR